MQTLCFPLRPPSAVGKMNEEEEERALKPRPLRSVAIGTYFMLYYCRKIMARVDRSTIR